MFKYKFIFHSILVVASLLTASTGFAAPLTTVPYVDLNRYIGKWHEIAAIPQYFQRHCVANTTAEYSMTARNRIRVYNSCETENQQRIASEGRAKIVDTQSNAKLKVTFAHIGEKYFYTFGGKYWITYLDPDYHFAIVGHPNRKFGWILARDPVIHQNDLVILTTELKIRGYDTCQFLTTPQKNGFLSKSRLCDLAAVDNLSQDMRP